MVLNSKVSKIKFWSTTCTYSRTMVPKS